MNDLSARALVTLEEARSYCWRDENDGSRDAILVDAVNYASAAIWLHCEREFRPTQAATRTFALLERHVDGERVGWIDLSPYELRSATSVVLYSDTSSPQTLTASQYRLQPYGGTDDGTYLDIVTIGPLRSPVQPGFGWQAQVTGNWGMASVPEVVKLAALEWVKNLTANPGSFASSSQAGYIVTPDTDTIFHGGGMPASVRYRLQPYRRRP
ncbi:MAG: hypothetical protein RMM28_10285 [Thermoleophilia bacterium]|nr:hypothetical protein [Gaiellaceae bacterium]MDW8339513.1 hypothetical protein [Thermoleophilia bacterium]